MGFDGIVFDFDGLVLDTEAPIYATCIAAAKGAGLACVVVPNPLTESLDLSAADLRLDSLADCSLGDAIARIRSAEASATKKYS
jgi:beta-phosphoglucomutase-like phosphatase (HAD superfamily)